jgi:hypothetical protein
MEITASAVINVVLAIVIGTISYFLKDLVSQLKELKIAITKLEMSYIALSKDTDNNKTAIDKISNAFTLVRDKQMSCKYCNEK